MTRSNEHSWHRLWTLPVVAVALLLTAGAAAAQEDPYGGTTTTSTPPEVEPTCRLEVTAGEVGAEVEVTVSNVPAGGTVRVLLDGTEEARATAPADGPDPTTLVIPFTVPTLDPGDYLVTAVGAEFTLTCSPGDGRFEVLAGGAVLGGASGLTGLPRTGVYAALFVVVALVLLLAGRVLLGASRRRRSEHERRSGRRRSSVPTR